jgi:hypothetical protein
MSLPHQAMKVKLNMKGHYKKLYPSFANSILDFGKNPKTSNSLVSIQYL